MQALAELIIAGPEYEWAGRLLDQIGRRVLAGERFDVGDGIRIPRASPASARCIRSSTGSSRSWPLVTRRPR